ncbi:hypothetical protein QPK31_11775 [Massilia sp. YIM B02769]|uniref:hypothetical protein n=1 Tax=Massilia sp. YIM B02769 TaxID=3050129 RepID=UPI0025B6945D|nr:hypothetical protein [Massilia sp. YIM B02769]MDN4058899.1 hypothetical protein [Massilia sp. YIM B02769]
MRQLAVCLLCLAVSARAEPPAELLAPLPAPAPDAQLPKPASILRSRISDESIRKAVKETIAETWENPRRHENDTISATAYETFGRDFSEAKVPDCLHADGLKRQPTFFLGGLLALPFVAVAKIRGKCI